LPIAKTNNPDPIEIRGVARVEMTPEVREYCFGNETAPNLDPDRSLPSNV